ncbi:MAG: hypothetical protein WD845_14410 [Pirellulales bacterium]
MLTAIWAVLGAPLLAVAQPPTLLRPGDLRPAGDQAIYDSAVEPAAWYAQHPNPSEPLGFSGARMTSARTGRTSVAPEPVEGEYASETYAPDEFMPAEFAPDETASGEYLPMDESGEYFDAPAPAVSSGEWLRNGCWYTQQSAVYFSRSVGPKNSQILATEFDATFFEHDSPFLQIPIDMGWEPGLRSTLGRHIGRDVRNRDHSIEFTFLGLTHWHFGGGLASLEGNNIFTNLDPTFELPTFNRSTSQSFDQNSDFNSFELNYRIDNRLARDQMVYTRDSMWVRRATPGLLCSVYAGVRGVGINEQLRWLAESDVPVSTGSYFVVTHNTMVGPQAGLDAFYERADWRVGIRTKGAAMVNWASQSSTVRILNADGDPLEPNRDEYAKVHEASFVGELGFVGEYHLRPYFALRCSYDLMWATNLALAQNQLTFNPGLPAEIANSNSLFFQGLSLGFEIVR